MKADIQNAVNAGKVVTVSKTNISFKGWMVCGYIIVDPTTGSGAYMISGGLNGGWLDLDRLSKDLLWASYMFLNLAIILAFPFGIGIILAWSLSFSYMLANLALNGAEQATSKDFLVMIADFNMSASLLAFMNVLSTVTIGLPLFFCLAFLVLLWVGTSYFLNRVVMNNKNVQWSEVLC